MAAIVGYPADLSKTRGLLSHVWSSLKPPAQVIDTQTVQVSCSKNGGSVVSSLAALGLRVRARGKRIQDPPRIEVCDRVLNRHLQIPQALDLLTRVRAWADITTYGPSQALAQHWSFSALHRTTHGTEHVSFASELRKHITSTALLSSSRFLSLSHFLPRDRIDVQVLIWAERNPTHTMPCHMYHTTGYLLRSHPANSKSGRDMALAMFNMPVCKICSILHVSARVKDVDCGRM
ncbi:hypothetical protein P167DRAFT_562504 [Morchella conica CCBAS932]|uniref:Uncharacterized protein n=1 Tax=Morchella conica CCBAS932 TaxID=1392247 RepID=A0A3N4KZU4_9PEZI|nr:hypothetical protein P167DRAFT_562504 [Morchella conica CCBAS932]